MTLRHTNVRDAGDHMSCAVLVLYKDLLQGCFAIKLKPVSYKHWNVLKMCCWQNLSKPQKFVN